MLYPVLFVTYMVSGLRQGLAICVFLGVALPFYMERKWVRYVLAALVAASFHKVGYVWLTIEVGPLHVDTGRWIESAADLCEILLDDVADDVFEMTGNDHSLEDADPLELAEIKRRWKVYIDQLPEYAYHCENLLNRNK